MKKVLVLILAVSAISAVAFAEKAAEVKPEEGKVLAEQPKDPKAENQKMMYSLGFMMGENIKKNLIIQDQDEYLAIQQGMLDSLTNKTSQVKIDDYKGPITQRYKEDGELLAKRQREAQNEFLASKKKEKGVKTLEDGILYQQVAKGKGKSPSADSAVKVHYHGTLIDGTVFDSSVSRGEPIEFALGQVIPCWRKGMQEVKVGGKAQLVCPPETAYGNRPAGIIPPNSVLIFDVELLEVK